MHSPESPRLDQNVAALRNPVAPPNVPMSSSNLTSRRDFLQASAATLVAAAATERYAAEEKPMRIIDPHVHVWKNDPRYPWPKEEKDPPTEDALPERLLELMMANGVEK